MIEGKRIFITGGAGYLGKNLICRYAKDNEITVYSRDESKHYYLSKDFPSVRFVLGDIRDESHLVRSCRDHDIGIFAASLKQIDCCSRNPKEAFETIIRGAFNSRLAAIENEFESACFVSTDKSRAATTVYGAMKYVAGESFILNNSEFSTRFTTAIYGNVMNSTGSLIPLIWKAIREGMCLDLYHQEMTRFMLSIEEAIDLIELSLSLRDVNVLPVAKSFLVKDVFDIYKEKFGMKYRLGIPRANEKIHEIMASSEEIPRMRYLENYNAYVMSPVAEGNCKLKFESNEYSSKDSVLTKDQMLEHLDKNEFYHESHGAWASGDARKSRT